MSKDYNILKDKYGEKFAQLCRRLFPTLLETEGLLSNLIISLFAPNHQLYEDIISFKKEDEFKNLILNFKNNETKHIETNKTVRELLDEKGYDFFECHTEAQIQSFKKYYQPEEELCTFLGGRLEKCYVFWAVKRDWDKIKRENPPERDGAYGTSVISIQFTQNGHTLSIKNRYNHTVANPDATLFNNLDNINPGLTNAFEKEYNLKINHSTRKSFELPGYVKADDKKHYKTNYEINNIYYGPNNIIIDNGEVKQFDKSRYLLIDYFLIDLKEKKIIKYDQRIPDSFPNYFQKIDKIEIKNNGTKKIITIRIQGQNDAVIEIDKNNRIINMLIPNIEEVNDNFLNRCCYIKSLELPNTKKIGDNFCAYSSMLEEIKISQVEEIADNCLIGTSELTTLTIPKAKKIGNNFAQKNVKLQTLTAPSLEEIGDNCLEFNFCLEEINTPKIKKVGKNFLNNNERLKEIKTDNNFEKETGFLANNTYINPPKSFNITLLKKLKEKLAKIKKREEEKNEETNDSKRRKG